MNEFKVEVVSPAEAAAYLTQREESDSMLAYDFKGFVDIVCRDEKKGTVAWEIHQPNLVTDHARRSFANGNWDLTYVTLFTHSGSDPARYDRMNVYDPSGEAQVDDYISGWYDGNTLTRGWTVSFPSGTARRIGTIGLAYQSQNPNGMLGMAVNRVFAYTVLSPLKQQGASQTLEITYRVTLTPIF